MTRLTRHLKTKFITAVSSRDIHDNSGRCKKLCIDEPTVHSTLFDKFASKVGMSKREAGSIKRGKEPATRDDVSGIKQSKRFKVITDIDSSTRDNKPGTSVLAQKSKLEYGHKTVKNTSTAKSKHYIMKGRTSLHASKTTLLNKPGPKLSKTKSRQEPGAGVSTYSSQIEAG
jgi:hypothetical protein